MPASPYIVSGNAIAGGNAQFGADLTYWWLTTTPGTTIVNSITNLGSVQYSYQISSISGPFSSVVNHAPATLLGSDRLRLPGNHRRCLRRRRPI